MNILQNLDPTLLPYIGVACGLLCAVIMVLGFVLQVVGGFFDIFIGFFEVFLNILQGGPVAWCGCLMVVCGCIACSGVVFFMLNASSSCAAYPTNFCRWFGL